MLIYDPIYDKTLLSSQPLIKRPLTGTPSGRFMEVQRQGER